MNLKRLGQRICCGLLAFALVGTFVPTALAAPPAGADIYSTHYMIKDGEISDDALDATALGKLNPVNNVVIGDTNASTINLWVSSTDMSGDTYQIPYVIDGTENAWYLQQIVLTNYTNSQPLMNADSILEATGKENYTFDVAEIAIDPYTTDGYSWYDVCYGWTNIPPEQWNNEPGDQATYTVDYKLNYPSEVDSISIINENGIPPQEGQGYNKVPETVEALGGTVQEGMNFAVASGLNDAFDGEELKGFLAYNVNDSNTTSYYFAGWKDKNDILYDIDDIVTATGELAGENNVIQFTGVWNEIPPYSEAELKNIETLVPLDVFTRGDNGDLLIDQSTDTLTKEDNLISYTVSAAVNDDLLGKSNVPFKGEEFATFEIIVNVDPNLEFANRNPEGIVTLRMESKLVVPKTITITGGNSTWTGDGKEWTVTFNPNQLPSGENGLEIRIQAEFTKEDYDVVSDVMTLTGLDFKLKEDVFESTGGALQVNTSANMTAKMDLRNMAGPAGFANSRYRFWALKELLGKNDANGEEWRKYFGGGVDNPTAYVHALQFLDYKLADYDLSADKTATLQANTVTATIFESEPIVIRPADITVYEGGDGGYDAVVDGTETTTSDSLPHPMFRITTPDGTDPKDLTFHNGDKSWTVISDGNGYYHFSEGKDQDKVRVTYSYTDEDDVKHTVTEDAFDPATMGDVYGQLTIELYPGENNLSDVTATTKDGKTYRITANTGTLTVRAVENSDATSDIEDTAPATKLAPNTAMAVEPEGGTTYTLNDTGVELPEDHAASLLFDDIISSDGKGDERISKLQEAADTKLGGANENREYQIKYLDLVDANNGNAWITSSNGIDVYWGYPQDTDRNTEFTLLHFKGLHRDTSGGSETGFDPNDIAGAEIEIIDVENSENGIKFRVGSGDFSPFALVWEERGPIIPPTTYYTITATAGEGGAIAPDGTVRVAQGADRTFTISAAEGYVIADVLVDGESIGAVDSYTFENVRQNHTIEARFQPVSDVADPDDTGVSDWLNTDDHLAYLDGYPDNTFQPEEDMTRAEAAQMFYNLLRDQDVDTTVSFTDVAADAWYAEAVNTLATLEIVDGVGDNRFAPERTITRAEFTTMAMRFCQEIPTGENIFSDVDQDDWFYDYVVGSIQYGWINGYPDGTFRPNDTITRAEVTTIANRMLGRAADQTYVDGHQNQLRAFPDVTKGYWAYYDITEATNAHTYTKDSQGEDWTGLA